MTAGILVNIHRPDAVEAAREAASWLASRGHTVGVERESSPATGLQPFSSSELAQVDLMISLGGDGTLIRASHICSSQGIPILGIFFGSFGFVTPCEPEDMIPSLEKHLSGESTLENRMMLCTELVRSGQVVAELHCLNEAVVQRSATTRILSFVVTVNGKDIAHFAADGVMAATPTGSTAYSLSAGGPIMEPRMEALLVSGVMPHTLSHRTLVLPAGSVIELDVEAAREGPGGAVLSCDGQSRLHLLHSDRVRITRSPRVTTLVMAEEDDFLDKVALEMSHKGRHRGA